MSVITPVAVSQVEVTASRLEWLILAVTHTRVGHQPLQDIAYKHTA